jgi:CubicO group peptidase (beta-lactamase class C family)
MSATAADWLRLGLLLADDGRVGARQLLPAGWVDELTHDSPVHPGYGLGYRITDDAVAGRVLALETAGRQLLVAPALRRALLWIGKGQPPADLQHLLAAEAAVGGDMDVTERFPD